MKTAVATVAVRGEPYPINLLTEEELDALLECIRDLFATYGSRIFFEPDCELRVRCFERTDEGTFRIPFPSEWVTKTVTLSNGKEYRLFGDRVPVTPRLEHALWHFVTLQFEDVETA